LTQFNRECVLRVGLPDIAQEIRCTSASGLRITFEVDKSLIGYPATAIIKVYNLARDTRAYLREPGNRVELLVGYNSEGEDSVLTRLFLGDLVNVNDVRENPDTVTTVWARDGFAAYTEALSSVTFAAGASLKQVFKSAYTDMKAACRQLVRGSDGTPDAKITSPFSFAGQTADMLNKLGETYGYYWMIQDEELVFIPVGDVNANIPVVVISRGTGMIGSPAITEIGADVSCLLNPKIIPTGAIKVESDFSRVSLGNLLFRPINKTLGEGYYRVNRVVHRGDTRGNDWNSAITGRVLRA